jgi:K+-transporting ATPase ATPase B chain
MIPKKSSASIFHGQLFSRAILDSFKKLNLLHQTRNPVMLVTEIGSLLTTALWIQALIGKGEASPAFVENGSRQR